MPPTSSPKRSKRQPKPKANPIATDLSSSKLPTKRPIKRTRKAAIQRPPPPPPTTTTTTRTTTATTTAPNINGTHTQPPNQPSLIPDPAAPNPDAPSPAKKRRPNNPAATTPPKPKPGSNKPGPKNPGSKPNSFVSTSFPDPAAPTRESVDARYRALVQRSKAQWEAFCADPAGAGLPGTGALGDEAALGEEGLEADMWAVVEAEAEEAEVEAEGGAEEGTVVGSVGVGVGVEVGAGVGETRAIGTERREVCFRTGGRRKGMEALVEGVLEREMDEFIRVFEQRRKKGRVGSEDGVGCKKGEVAAAKRKRSAIEVDPFTMVTRKRKKEGVRMED